uniref:Uncharacterized protein n=1 Tax=Brassica oleracea var. oleracea TaxID=109376 RepID=A0A0D3DQF1_BRAOL
MKQHMVGVKGSTNGCTKVPPEVQHTMRKSLKENEEKAKQKRGVNMQLHDVDDGEGSTQVCVPPSQKRKVVNSRFYQPMISKIASMGHGYVGPSYHALRVGLLRDAKLQVSLIIDSLRSTWADSGCTLMGDGWKDTRQRPLINFLVYCPKGITFIKSVDASGICTNEENLCNLFAEIVDMIGPQNVVHMVTDSAPNYKAAGGRLVERYPTIYWSPCAAHCINLILEDVGKLPHVHNLTSNASKITVFVYNHKHILNWLRNRPDWREIIRPGETRFATSFIALQSLHAHKDILQSMVVDEEFRKISRSEKAKLVKQLIFNEDFWKECFMIVQIMTPLIRLLRICDADEKPSLPYVYEGMYRARLGIKNIFKKEKPLYRSYTRIIDNRWDRMLRSDIYAAAYFLNPAFLYDQKNFCDKAEITRGVLNLIEKQKGSLSETKLVSTFRCYRDREMALTCSKTTRPDEWWKLFGCDIPDLQKLAIRILSQTASSSGCE